MALNHRIELEWYLPRTQILAVRHLEGRHLVLPAAVVAATRRANHEPLDQLESTATVHERSRLRAALKCPHSDIDGPA